MDACNSRFTRDIHPRGLHQPGNQLRNPLQPPGFASSLGLRFYYLPKFALAAIVMNSVIPLVAFQEARHLFHVKKQDFLLWASWRWTAGPADFWEFS